MLRTATLAIGQFSGVRLAANLCVKTASPHKLTTMADQFAEGDLIDLVTYALIQWRESIQYLISIIDIGEFDGASERRNLAKIRRLTVWCTGQFPIGLRFAGGGSQLGSVRRRSCRAVLQELFYDHRSKNYRQRTLNIERSNREDCLRLEAFTTRIRRGHRISRKSRTSLNEKGS